MSTRRNAKLKTRKMSSAFKSSSRERLLHALIKRSFGVSKKPMEYPDACEANPNGCCKTETTLT